ncbi:MAG: DUF2269 family protein [Pseudomonadota bacterium]
MDYLWVKWLHVLSSTLLFGTGLGIAFFTWMAHRTGDAAHIARTARVTVIADGVFTAPAVVVQFATGAWMVHVLGIPYSTFWLGTAVALFFLVGACWLPVVWLQVRARDLAREALARDGVLPAGYHRVMRWWFVLGWPAFVGVMAIFALMVRKPT